MVQARTKMIDALRVMLSPEPVESDKRQMR